MSNKVRNAYLYEVSTFIYSSLDTLLVLTNVSISFSQLPKFSTFNNFRYIRKSDNRQLEIQSN